MHMTLQQLLREKGMSRYQLSKASGIPWATLSDLFSGKTALTRCSAGTLGKLSAALGVPMEQLLTMTVEQTRTPDGKPKDRSFNSNQWCGAITQEQADYLRAKYL